jgi:hypothetical protein
LYDEEGSLMASTDALPFPQKNVAYRVTFPIMDADGDLVTAAASLDSEISKDAGTFTDCTNEATEIATSSGMYYLDLTSTEMNADCVAIIVKTGTAGAKTTSLVLYPEEAGDIRVNVTSFGGTAGTFSGGRPEVNTTLIEGSDATNQIRDSVVDDATRIDASALNTLSSHDPGETIMGATDLGTGTGFTAIPWNAAWDAEVQSEVTDALVAYDPPTHAELVSEIDAVQADIAALNDIAVADIFSYVVEGAYTFEEVTRGFTAALLGKASGLATATATFRNTNDDVDVIVATVDASGNRSAVTLDLTDTP